MITYQPQGVHVYQDGRVVPAADDSGRARTIAYQLLAAHNRAAEPDRLCIRFDSLTSHDITYVGVIQTLRAARPDITSFPLPYALSNCHNSLCAVGGTINSDDHAFGLSAARKYGGIFVPPHIAVIHQYMREEMAGCGRMILGSDSHTRYGALGTMGIGEGGGELVKQLLGRTYDLAWPEVVGVKLTGAPPPWVGPQDVALALIGHVFDKGLVKNKVLEFFGDGVRHLSVDYRNGIDVMTTETACLSSIWATDEQVESYYALHGRADAYKRLSPGDGAYYDALITIDLSQVKPMVALPFHPSHVYAIEDVARDPAGVAAQAEKTWPEDADFSLKEKIKDGRLYFEQGIITGCAGGLYENICAAADILDGHAVGSGPFNLHIYPASQPIYLALAENGTAARLMRAGAVLRTAFCGPCFGAGEVPPHRGLSARHATRNFPNREGSKPGNGQSAAVALMDARSVAATAVNKGYLTAASEKDTRRAPKPYYFEKGLYADAVYDGFGQADEREPLVTGPGIRDWPAMRPLPENVLLTVAALITDPVTTTDELIPSGEASSFRSNPMALAEFTLSRKDPAYVGRAKAAVLPEVLARVKAPIDTANTGVDSLGSVVYAARPGDGSAREQAASCQRVLGGLANIAREYATKRYRSNLVNWGMLPFILADAPPFKTGDLIYIPGIREAVRQRAATVTAYVAGDGLTPFTLALPGLTEDEAAIILRGGLINYYGGGV